MPSFLFPVLIVVQVLAAFAVILLVMLQQGKGADMGSAFGGGSAGSVFGSAGASNFFSRMTKWAAVVFFACTLGLAYIGTKSTATSTSSGPDAGLMEQFSDVPVVPGAVPAAPTVDDDAAVPSVPSAEAPEVPAATPEVSATESVETEPEATEQAEADTAAVPSMGAPEAAPAAEEKPAAAQ